MVSVKFDFSLRFTMQKNNGFVLKIRLVGQPNGSIVKVNGLKNPDFKSWNVKEQKFLAPTEEAIYNNRLLSEMLERYQSVVDNASPQTPAELKQMVENGISVKASEELTYGDFLRQEIQKKKDNRGKKPSKNYQNYIGLLHKLEMEGNIINIPLSEISNEHFAKFGDYILTLSVEEGRNNYENLMIRFKHIHSNAFVRGLAKTQLTYKYTKDKPTITPKERISLTKEQYDKFTNLDLSKISQTGINPQFNKEIYRDFCVFLYEAKMRPCDVVRLHSSNIVKIQDMLCLSYIVEKKKNIEAKKTCVPLTPKALKIIEKYKGKSTKGYIFPFSMNEYDWDYDDTTSWNKWTIRKQALLQQVNCFLQKVAPFIGVEPKDFTTYVFRHSTITQSVIDGMNPVWLASCAGTSIKQIEDHYFHSETFILESQKSKFLCR